MPHDWIKSSLDHLGLVAGMFDELGIGDGIDKATRQNPAISRILRATLTLPGSLSVAAMTAPQPQI
jgi:hypothetical protein